MLKITDVRTEKPYYLFEDEADKFLEEIMIRIGMKEVGTGIWFDEYMDDTYDDDGNFYHAIDIIVPGPQSTIRLTIHSEIPQNNFDVSDS